ncbi:MAG: 4Fe-4S binding protein [bacterium]
MANRWRCGNCGYRLEADVPPETCPGCRQKCEFIDDNPYVPVDQGEAARRPSLPQAQCPVVVPEKCTGCERCIEVCPIEAIEMRGEVAWIDPEICDGDGVCIPACPEGAIVLPQLQGDS